MHIIYIFFSFLTEILIVTSMILNGELCNRIGVINIVVINYLIDTLASTILYYVKSYIKYFFSLFSSGVMSVLTTYIFNVLVHKIPTVYTVILRFIGQMLTSVTIYYLYLYKKGGRMLYYF